MTYRSKPLPLEGTLNTRDLGGYPAGGSKITKSGKFLRSDSLERLTEKDKQMLWEYGVRCVIDLRSGVEVERGPYEFGQGIKVCSFPLLDQIQSNGFQGEMPESLEMMYRDLLQNSKETIGKVLLEMLDFADDCVLYHCTAGKDRTGIVTMLLLWLAGVPDEDIIADYAITESNMAPMFAQQKAAIAKMGIEIPDFLLESRPESMCSLLAYMREAYGSACKYLLEAGLTEEQIAALKKQIL